MCSCRKKVVSSLRGVVIRFATLELELALVAFTIVMSKGNCEKGSVEKVPWWTMVQILPRRLSYINLELQRSPEAKK